MDAVRAWLGGVPRVCVQVHYAGSLKDQPSGGQEAKVCMPPALSLADSICIRGANIADGDWRLTLVGLAKPPNVGVFGLIIRCEVLGAHGFRAFV